MKNLILILSLFCIVSCAATAQAQNFDMRVYHLGEDVYKSFGSSGVVMTLDSECTVEDYEDVTLHFFGNPADSSVGPLFDNITYTVKIPTIVEGAIEDVPHVMSCGVYGVHGLRVGDNEPVVTVSRSRWDDVGKRLVLEHTEIWQFFENTGDTYAYAQLLYLGDGEFLLEELIK